MNEPTAPETTSSSPTAEEIVKIEPPGPTSTIRRLTFHVPHILKSITLDADGFTHRDVREGGPRQIDFETVIEYSEKPVDEKDQVFKIRATNQLNFAGSVINVINDAVELPNFRLVPTSPTASEYLGKVGQRVMISSACNRHQQFSAQLGKDIYYIARIYITLP